MVTALAAGRVGEATDSEIIQASWQSPDRFGALYDRYATVLYGFACLRVGQGSADDVVADTFLAAFAQRHTYDFDRCSARPWLFGILTNKIAERSRPRRSIIGRTRERGRTRSWTMDEMDRLADLKVALYPADGPSEELRARALASVAGGAVPRSALPARRRWMRPALVAAGVAVVAAGAVLLAGAVGTSDAGDGGPSSVRPAAFTLQVNADGSATLTAHDVIDTVAATEALNGAGIAGRVINDITAGCTTKSDDIEPSDLYPDNTLSRGLGSSETVTLRSSDYPVGGGLLVVVTSRGGDSGGRPVPPDPVSVVIFAFDDAGKIPTCVDFADPGTGTP